MVERIPTSRIFIGYSTVDKQVPLTREYDVDLIKRDLLNHFMTRRGERVMNPEFGSIVWDLLFEPFTEAIKQQIIADAQTIIEQEPRVDLVDMDVTEGDQSITVEITLNYLPFNIVDSLFAEFIRDNFSTTATDPVFISELQR